MDKTQMLIGALLILIILGFLHSMMNKPKGTTTTYKTVVVKKPIYVPPPRYGYVPPPHYNRYKAQYYY